MSYDYKAKGSADFKAGKKDERLFHNPEDHGRLYREGWHGARRAAADDDRGSGFEHAGQTPPTSPLEKSPTGGTFVITAGGKTSEPIHFKAKPDVVAAALERLTASDRCPNDTDGDGDCHLCFRKGGCPNLRKPDPAPAPEKPLAAPPGVPGAGEDGQLDLFG